MFDGIESNAAELQFVDKLDSSILDLPSNLKTINSKVWRWCLWMIMVDIGEHQIIVIPLLFIHIGGEMLIIAENPKKVILLGGFILPLAQGMEK